MKDCLDTREDLKDLFLEYADEMYQYAYTRLNYKKEAAEDIVQELFMKVWDSRTRYDSRKASLRTWLYSILRNMIIDTYRREGRYDKLPIIEDLLPQYDTENDSKLIVESALGKLNETDAEIIILKHVQGLSLKEIAAIYDKNPGNIKVILHRAMQKLKKAIEG